MKIKLPHSVQQILVSQPIGHQGEKIKGTSTQQCPEHTIGRTALPTHLTIFSTLQYPFKVGIVYIFIISYYVILSICEGKIC